MRNFFTSGPEAFFNFSLRLRKEGVYQGLLRGSSVFVFDTTHLLLTSISQSVSIRARSSTEEELEAVIASSSCAVRSANV